MPPTRNPSTNSSLFAIYTLHMLFFLTFTTASTRTSTHPFSAPPLSRTNRIVENNHRGRGGKGDNRAALHLLVSFHSRFGSSHHVATQGVHRETYVWTRSCSAVGPKIQKMFPFHIKPPTVSAGTRSTLSLTKDQSHTTIEREHHIVGEGGILAPSSISACFFYLRILRERSHTPC